MKEATTLESLEQTVAACALLIDIAQHSVDHHGWDPVIVRYLDTLGERTHAALTAHGGMGAVAPMKRSAAAVEELAHTGAGRETGRPRAAARVARHDKQPGAGVPVRRFKAGRAAR
jgi:mitochondrial fission protein ELM1